MALITPHLLLVLKIVNFCHIYEVVANIGHVADAKQVLSTAKRLAAEALECASATEVRRTVDSLSLRTFSKTKDDGA